GSPGPLRFINPVRVLDTRASDGQIVTAGFNADGSPITAGQLAANSSRRFPISGKTLAQGSSSFAFPGDVTGVLVNVTIVQAAPSGGFVTVFPGDVLDANRPNASTVNPSTTIAFNFWATGVGTAPGSSGTIAVFSTNALDLIIDIVGYYAPDAPTTAGNL